MTNTAPSQDPGIGLTEANTDIKMISTSAVDPGDVVAVDGTVGSETRFDTVKTPVTADLELGLFAVALETVAAGAQGMFRFRGMVKAQTASTPAVGAKLAAANGVTTIAASAAVTKVIAYALVTGTTVPTLVMFNGIEGYGNDNA